MLQQWHPIVAPKGMRSRRDLSPDLAMPNQQHLSTTLATALHPHQSDLPKSTFPFQILHDGRTAALWQEGAFLHVGTQGIDSPELTCPLLAITSNKASACHLQLPLSLCVAGPAPILPMENTGWGPPHQHQSGGLSSTRGAAGVQQCRVSTALRLGAALGSPSKWGCFAIALGPDQVTSAA